MITQLSQGQISKIIKQDTSLKVPYPALIDVNHNLVMLIMYKGKKQPAKIPVVTKDGLKYDLPPASNYSTAGKEGVIATPYRVPLKKFSLNEPDLSDETFMGKSNKTEPKIETKVKKDTLVPPKIVYVTKTNIPGITKIIIGCSSDLLGIGCFGKALSDHYDFSGISNISIIQYKNNQQVVKTSDFNNIEKEIERVQQERKKWIISGCVFVGVGTVFNTWGIIQALKWQVISSPDGLSLVKRF